MEGWIKLHRNLKDWEWYDDHNCTRLLIHILLTVNHKEKQWRGIKIPEGSRITSWEKLSIETGLSIQQVRTAIRKMESSGELTRKLTGKSQLVSLVKWGKLQQSKEQNNNQNNSNSTDNQQLDNRLATDNQQLLKNVKNNKNENNDKEEFGLSKSKRFIKPDIQQIKDYCLERKNSVNPEVFFNHYEANGWKRGKSKMVDWKACVRTWEQNEKNGFRKNTGTNKAGNDRQEFENPYA